MPELPEVETVRRDLSGAVTGKTIIAVKVMRPQVIRQPGPRQFAAGVRGAAIRAVLRQGKLLILELSTGQALTVHLKMTGQLVYPGTAAKSRVSFRFSDGTWLDFNDQRVFGELRLLDNWRELALVKNFGPEPLTLSEKELSARLASKKTRIKPLLLDQSFIAGIGNLYAAEILFAAGISPQRPANSLSMKEISRLHAAMGAVLRRAIKYGGSSIDDYVRVSGKPGTFVRYHKVYGRAGKACPACKTTVKRINVGGRGTYFCPRCQH